MLDRIRYFLSNDVVWVLHHNIGLSGCFAKISFGLRYLEGWEY